MPDPTLVYNGVEYPGYDPALEARRAKNRALAEWENAPHPLDETMPPPTLIPRGGDISLAEPERVVPETGHETPPLDRSTDEDLPEDMRHELMLREMRQPPVSGMSRPADSAGDQIQQHVVPAPNPLEGSEEHIRYAMGNDPVMHDYKAGGDNPGLKGGTLSVMSSNVPMGQRPPSYFEDRDRALEMSVDDAVQRDLAPIPSPGASAKPDVPYYLGKPEDAVAHAAAIDAARKSEAGASGPDTSYLRRSDLRELEKQNALGRMRTDQQIRLADESRQAAERAFAPLQAEHEKAKSDYAQLQMRPEYRSASPELRKGIDAFWQRKIAGTQARLQAQQQNFNIGSAHPIASLYKDDPFSN